MESIIDSILKSDDRLTEEQNALVQIFMTHQPGINRNEYDILGVHG